MSEQPGSTIVQTPFGNWAVYDRAGRLTATSLDPARAQRAANIENALAASQKLLAEYDAGGLTEGHERAEYLAEQLRELTTALEEGKQ